jgi:hypothetical protein
MLHSRGFKGQIFNVDTQDISATIQTNHPAPCAIITTSSKPPATLTSAPLDSVQHGPLTIYWSDSASGWVQLTHFTQQGQASIAQTEQQLAFSSGQITMTLRSGKPGILSITGTITNSSGLSLNDNQLQITTSTGYAHKQSLDRQPIAFDIPAIGGAAIITVTMLHPLPEDTDVVLQNLRWNWKPADATWAAITRIDNPNGLESIEDEPFFWLGKGSTTIHVRTRTSGQLQLYAYFLMGPSLPDAKSRRLLVTTKEGYKTEITLKEGEQTIVVPISITDATITLTPMDKPVTTTTGNNDTRPLLIGVKGIRAELH